MTATASDNSSPFHVPSFIHALGGVVQRSPQFWLRLARLESWLLRDELSRVAVNKPIYICGLARSGSTFLHEVVSSHPGVATQRAKDYPMLFTPYWWRRATAKIRPTPPRERAHQDRVMVSTESPEALEEMVWMRFFPSCHDPSVSNVLGAADRHRDFESFYDEHLRKLLLAEGAVRYAAKANYHIARLEYLARLYPDARFLIPVRTPETHIASLMRQQQLFVRGHHKYPRSLAYMRRTGHFEFGIDRRPINLGDAEQVRRIEKLWAAGEEVRGLAAYWNMVHSYLKCLLDSDDRLRTTACVVPFEDVRTSPTATLSAALNHCELPEADSVARRFAPQVRTSNYYDSGLSDADRAAIREETAATSLGWGYG